MSVSLVLRLMVALRINYFPMLALKRGSFNRLNQPSLLREGPKAANFGLW